MRPLSFLLLFGLLGCGEQPPSKTGTAPKGECGHFPGLSDRPISLQFEVQVSGGSRPLIDLTTNLPEGTQIGSMLKSPGYPPAFIAQASGNVKCGKVTIGPYSKQGGPIPEGAYEISVTAPLVIVQPKSVRKYLGDDYSNFRSDLITKRSSGGDIGGRIISYSDTLMIKPPS
jgi:hypothetical protein